MSIAVISFGETMLRLTAPNHMRLETTPHLQVYVGGTESNTLACLARLGLQVSWMSALPATPLGRHITTELHRHGVSIDHVVWTEQGRLGIFYAEEVAQPLGLQVHYDRANSACALVNPESVNYAAIDDAQLLHLTGITPGLGMGARTVFQRLLERARNRQIPLSFDVNYRAKLWSASEAAQEIEEACKQAEILFCARADATELWGMNGTPAEILQQMASRFGADQPTKHLVLTLGSDGSAQLVNGEYQHEPVIPAESAQRFGSGDAFSAGYLYAYLQGPLYQEVQQRYSTTPLTFGNALAALKRCIAGDIAIISPDDVRLILQNEQRRFR